MTTATARCHRATTGFTLVEVLVALFLFALIAFAATALTASATRSLTASDAVLAGVQQAERTRALMAADLGQALPRPSLTREGDLLRAFTLTPDGFVLVRGGLDGVAPSARKIAWGFDGTQWLRQEFPAVDGAEPGPAVVMATGITDVRIRVATEAGWQDGWAPAQPEHLPRAVEVTLARADGRALRMAMRVAA